MRIAAAGSWKTENVDTWNLSDDSGFTEACRSVGAEIARRNHQLVIGSDSETTADYRAVEGVVQALGTSNVNRPPIIVVPGLALPEKFERLASSVDEAIAVVTPDDVGGLADSATSVNELEARARENAWLEVGWFWGRLGRNRFMLLVRGQPSIPNDLSGIEYYAYSSQADARGDVISGFIKCLRELP